MNVSRLFVPLFLSVLALSSMIGCGRESLSASGLPAASGRFATITSGYPGVVMVIAPNGSGLCTGVVVSERAVLTAAHCVQVAGTYTVRGSIGTFTTTTVLAHGPGLVDDPEDIALLIFNSDITNDAEAIHELDNTVDEGDAVTLVGFGCSSIEARTGAGVKREGSNIISEKSSDYLVLLTPKETSVSVASRGIIGDATQSGTCFGDSGGPLFRRSGGKLKVVGLTHAGGSLGNYYLSEFVNVADRAANVDWIAAKSAAYDLNIQGI